MEINKICQECKQCCQGSNLYAYFTQKEYEEIKRTIKIKKAIKYRGLIRIPYENGKCYFLKDEGCILNKNRPITCRMYPFRPNRKYGIILRTNCKHWTKFQKEELRQAKSEYEGWKKREKRNVK